MVVAYEDGVFEEGGKGATAEVFEDFGVAKLVLDGGTVFEYPAADGGDGDGLGIEGVEFVGGGFGERFAGLFKGFLGDVGGKECIGGVGDGGEGEAVDSFGFEFGADGWGKVGFELEEELYEGFLVGIGGGGPIVIVAECGEEFVEAGFVGFEVLADLDFDVGEVGFGGGDELGEGGGLGAEGEGAVDS